MALDREAVMLDLKAQIAASSEKKLKIDAIDANAEMCDRGYLDSLSYVAFLVHIEETYGTRILDHQLTGSLKTLNAVADHVMREAKNK